jgi:putative hemolysin
LTHTFHWTELKLIVDQSTVAVESGDGGEYGVCVFADNQQCDEWTLTRGDCPLVGAKITGYVTQAAQLCAITGGAYKVTTHSKTDQEQGACTLNTGKTCDAGDYFNGKCSPDD